MNEYIKNLKTFKYAKYGEKFDVTKFKRHSILIEKLSKRADNLAAVNKKAADNILAEINKLIHEKNAKLTSVQNGLLATKKIFFKK